MSQPTERDREIERNYHFFKSRVDDIVAEHQGEFALIRHQEVVAYHADFFAALADGRRRYPDELFSIQEVTMIADTIGAF